MYWRPVVDYVEVFPPTAALLAGNASNVPVMMGTNRGMLRLFQQECSDTVPLVCCVLSPHGMDPKLVQKGLTQPQAWNANELVSVTRAQQARPLSARIRTQTYGENIPVMTALLSMYVYPPNDGC